MSSRLVVLGSGSSGNSTLIDIEGAGVLVDIGFGPTEIASRLATRGVSWSQIRAVILTHSHTDHWNRYTLEHLRRLNVPLFMHPSHHSVLSQCDGYQPLRRAGLLKDIQPLQPVALLPNLTALPIPVPHDSDPTFAFRFDYGPRLKSGGWSVGYATDLGTVSRELLEELHGVEVLVMEFNHDVRMERRSRRHRELIDRVLSDTGHLSNRQAADALQALVQTGWLNAVIPIHLSQECNTPAIVARICSTVLKKYSPQTICQISLQDQPTPDIDLIPRGNSRTLPALPIIRQIKQPTLMDFLPS